MNTVSRAERLLNTLYTIQLYPGINARRLARMIGVQPRSVQRYVKELRELGFEVISSAGVTGGFLYKGSYNLRPVSFTGSETLAVFVAARIILQKPDFPFQENLQTALNKISDVVARSEKEFFVRLEPRLSFLIDQIKGNFPWENIFSQINEAIAKRQVLELACHSDSANGVDSYRVEPHHVIFKDGTWSLVAFCCQKKEISFFRLDKVDSINVTEDIFPWPGDFDLQKSIYRNWQAAKADPLEITVKFSPQISGLIKEGSWHSTQTIQELGEGEIIFRVTVKGTRELKKWILSWGQYAEVIAPEVFRQEIRQDLMNMTRKYEV